MATETDGAVRKTLLEQLVRAHTSELARFARARVKDPDVADDLVQMTFIAAWDSIGRYAHESSHRTWLFAILKHKLADHYRKQYREAKHLSGAGEGSDEQLMGICDVQGNWTHQPHNTEDFLVPAEDQRKERLDRALRACLDSLPAHWRSAVEMKFLLDRDAKEICATLGISDTNYWQQIHRAKLRLRGCIEGLLGTSEN
jgi:RNA polymerase sigma-70 factor (TIGR02943 family)